MSLSLLFGLVGIIVTICFGVWGIIVIVQSRYPGRITFIREECISLFLDIVKNMPDLSILHKSHPVKENLVLLKGYFLNSGTKDITESMVNENLAACLPKDFKWVEARVVDTSENVQARPKIDNDNRFSFNLGLFRRNEFIKFEALAEVPIKEGELSPGERLSKEIQFTHRISDTRVVETKSLPVEADRRPSLRKIIPPIALLIFSLMFVLGMFNYAGVPVKINFLLTDSEGQEMEVRVRRNPFGKLLVRQVDGDFKAVYSADAFFSKGPFKAKLGQTKFERITDRVFVGLICLFLTLSLFLGIIVYIHHRKTKRLKKLLKHSVRK